MFLQLHDGPAMAQKKRYPNVPDLRLPEMLKIDNRQIMMQAAEEAAVYASKRLQESIQKDSTTNDLPTLDVSALENLELEVVPEDDNGMGFSWKQAAQFLIKNWRAIVEISKNFARYYQVQNLNNMTPQQIDEQLALISGDLLNATADKEKVDAMTLSRFSQVYQQRKIMLPAINQRTMLIAGGALLAFLLLKK